MTGFRRRLVVGAILAVAGALGIAAPAGAAPATFDMYEASVSSKQLSVLQEEGYDVAAIEQGVRKATVDLVLTAADRATLSRKGIDTTLLRDRQGRTVAQRAAAQARQGFDVYRDYDSSGGIRDELYRFARDHRAITELHVIGETHEGREIIAIRMTQGVRDVPVGARPSVFYQGTIHAREWIATEVSRRMMHWFADRRHDDPEIRALLRETELWFVPVANPDGYQYTFDAERLWRKNMRDNNEDGQISVGDGVDPNRNYPEHWGYDDFGSSPQTSSDTYRGPGPASEPEVQAQIDLHEEVGFEFAMSYHSYGELLLYPQGWQVQTPSADDPVYVALTGTDTDPAVPGYNPGVSADLYTTNGEYTDWAHGETNTLAWTTELPEGCEGCGFVFPDNEALVQQTFQDNIELAVNIARSADDPDDPASHAGIDTEPFYLDVSETDPWKSHHPSSDLTFDTSYSGGAAQPVDVLAKRDLGDVTLHYRINDGVEQTTGTTEAPEGEIYGGNNAYDTYYHYLRGEVTGARAGDSVEVWFEGGGQESDHFTYDVVEDADADVLILAAEDRTGASNLPAYGSTDPAAPNYLSFYEDALAASGSSYDVYDVDASGRAAPDALGVLGHYDAVLWYTGNDLVTREPGWGPGNASRLANDMMLEVRSYLNDGGKVLYTGQWAGGLENGVAGTQLFDPVANEQCVVGGEIILDRCQVISDKNDFLQYYLGAFVYNSDGGTNPDTGEPFPIDGVSDPFTEFNWLLNGGDGAGNQIHTASFLTTSSFHPVAQFPQFASDAPAVWNRGLTGPAPFEPFHGTKYMYSEQANISYKRLAREIDLSGFTATDAPTLTFHTSYDTEPAWDFLFVEVHTVGQDNWTTLPATDSGGNTITSNDTGESCPEGWFELHPWLERYQGADCSGANATTGGQWNAASGRSAGWEEWNVDLSAYAGQQVEVSISYASDWGVQGVGVFVDQTAITAGGETLPGSTSFEDDDDPMDGWTTPGPPEGSDINANDWTRSASKGFEEGAAVSTDDTLYFGFGFEGIQTAAERNEVMARSTGYLLGG
jgi:murein tripeptide amidase MpaA